MSFQGYLETRFRRVYFQKNIRTTRICAVIVPAALLGITAIHFALSKSSPDLTFLLPIVALLGINVGHIALTFTERLWRYNDWILAFGNVTYSVLLGYVTYQLPPAYFASMFGFILLYILGGYAATSSRFPFSLASQVMVSVVWITIHLLKGLYPSPGGEVFLLVAYFLGVNIFGATVCRVLETYAREQFLLNELLTAEKDHSNTILHNALPPAIVSRLGRGAVVADFHSDVAVVFADLVGFTKYSSDHPVRTVATMLNELFSTFDGVVTETGLEKIKTIGDSYMAAAGVPGACPDPAHRAVTAAIKLLDQLKQFNARYQTNFDLRIGIHVGAVIAGVIGQKKYSYDIWGDAVNVASRMESTGMPGLIQVSEAVRERLGTQFDFSEPLTKMVKGKGAVVTYFVVLPQSRSLISEARMAS
jgi:class 3 adenylate cyclase